MYLQQTTIRKKIIFKQDHNTTVIKYNIHSEKQTMKVVKSNINNSIFTEGKDACKIWLSGIIHISQTDCKLKQKQPFFLYETVNVHVILQFLQPHMQYGLNCVLLESVSNSLGSFSRNTAYFVC